MNRYRFIEAQRGQHPVCLLCEVLGVPASGYYAWQQAKQQTEMWSGIAGHCNACNKSLVNVYASLRAVAAN